MVWFRGSSWDLNRVLPHRSGRVLTEATAINDAEEIAGTGILDGEKRAFLLTWRGASTGPPPAAALFNQSSG